MSAAGMMMSHQVDILYHVHGGDNLQSDLTPVCAGTIISSYLILTVATCLAGRNESLLKIRANGKNGYEGQIRRIDKVFSYSALDSEASPLDLALIRLNSELELNGLVPPQPPNYNDTQSPASSSLICEASVCREEVGRVRLVNSSECAERRGDKNVVCTVLVENVTELSKCEIPLPGSSLLGTEFKDDAPDTLYDVLAMNSSDLDLDEEMSGQKQRVFTNVGAFCLWIQSALDEDKKVVQETTTTMKTPPEEVTTKKTSPEEVPTTETPPKEVSITETPPEEVPTTETPPEEVPTTETPPEEVPTTETPPEEVPITETPPKEVTDYDDYSSEHEDLSSSTMEKAAVVPGFDRENWQVAVSLFKEAKITELKNLVFSPLSLTTSMIMLNEGARGDTAKEVQTLFKFSGKSQDLILNQGNALNSLKNQTSTHGGESGVQLLTASRIYANSQNAKLLENYVRAVSSLGDVETLDFSDPKPAVAEINDWVKNQTQGEISQTVQDGDIDKEAGAVLLNTLYFKAPWKTEFNQSHTTSAEFHVSDSEKVQVEMMHILEDFPFADLEEVEASAVFLPYKGDRLSMIIYLPWVGRKLSVLEGKLENLVPSEVRNNATTTKISLYLPKFNISSSLDFEEIVTSLGLQKMFNKEEADFGKLSEVERFHVSKVRQNLFFQVNEEGEPAKEIHGLTGTEIKVDRPFLFQIYDSLTRAVLISGRISNPNDRGDGPKVVTDSERDMWDVAATLYKRAQKHEQENWIFSPLSLTTSMAMLNSGAEGETAREIENLFKFGPNSEFSVQNQTEILKSLTNQALEKQSDVQLVTASRIYANIKNAQLRWNYVRAVGSLGGVETLDFSQPKQVVTQINEWVKNQTHGKISKITEDKDFDEETAVVLLNALYFKAPWKFPFNQSDTKEADFNVNANKKVQVDTMYLSTELPFIDLQEVEASAVFLPYKADRFSMVIYLPWVGKKLSTLEEKLESLIPTEVRNEATTTAVSLYLPKFNISSSLDFKEIFKSLGVQKMFKEEEADFSRLSESKGFYVSKVRQNIFMEVNEEGTEAAAVTAVEGLSAVSAPNLVRVDRPFIFQIYDSVTGAVLLSGRISNPNERGDKPKLVTESEKKIWNVAASLYKKAIKIEHENVIFSPLSLTSSIVMLNAGAEGETAREIQSLFHFVTNSQLAIRMQTKILHSLTNQALEKESGVTFSTASRIFANNKTAQLLPNYMRAVSSLGDVETLDFTDPKPVVAHLNSWVKNQTQGKITKIAGDKDFEKDTAVVLLDTLYFKAPWKQPFNKNDTQKDNFHVSENETEKVEMMYISAEFPFVDLDEVEASALFLPYQGGRISMIIYLPWAGRNLSTVEEKLETLVPSQVRNEAMTGQIAVFLPKFNISSSVNLKSVFKLLGVERMFNRTVADFSKMTESPEFHVSKLLQQVFIQVNEEGTEAAALTEAHGLPAVSAPNVLRVDRPFIFQIFDHETGAILLSGRVTNPNGNTIPVPPPTRASGRAIAQFNQPQQFFTMVPLPNTAYQLITTQSQTLVSYSLLPPATYCHPQQTNNMPPTSNTVNEQTPAQPQAATTNSFLPPTQFVDLQGNRHMSPNPNTAYQLITTQSQTMIQFVTPVANPETTRNNDDAPPNSNSNTAQQLIAFQPQILGPSIYLIPTYGQNPHFVPQG